MSIPTLGRRCSPERRRNDGLSLVEDGCVSFHVLSGEVAVLSCQKGRVGGVQGHQPPLVLLLRAASLPSHSSWVVCLRCRVYQTLLALHSNVITASSFRHCYGHHSGPIPAIGMAIPVSTIIHPIPTLGTEPLTGTTPERRMESCRVYLDLDPHPGGWGYLHVMLATICMVCAGLRDIAAPQIASAHDVGKPAVQAR